MRYAYIALVAVLGALLVLFMAQNLQSVTVSLFAVNLAMPVWLLVLIVYVLGAFTGGAVYAFLRASVQGTRRTPA
jgi:uncharacterized integral membrane protein